MATELNLEQKLADLLDTRDFHPEMLGKDGRPSDADKAKTFSFDYVSSTGKNYGTMVVILGADNEMYIMYGDNLGKTIEDPEDRSEFFDFQQQLSDLANRNRWTATLADISKLKRVQAGIAAIKEGLFEGYYGTRRVSYAGEPTEARLMIKHNRTLGENDARFRYVESIFIETADGERFKLPYTNMTGARAMLEHVRQGGKPYDIRGNHICEMVTELKVLNRFNRAAGTRMMEGVTQQIVEQAQQYYSKLRESLKHLGSSRGYNTYFESWHPLDVQEQESLVEDIKTMFIEQTLDTRIEAALPLLARIQQQGNDMKEAEIFESWINNLAEGTWNLPETPEQVAKLKELMSKELIVGPDATNATEQLYDLVGDDELFDRLGDLAQRDPRANAWNDTEVMNRLRELGIETETQAPAGAEGDAAPVGPAAAATAPAATPVPQQPVAEGLDPEKRARLDDLIGMYRDSTDPSDYYDSEYEDPEEVLNMIRAEFGDRVADQIEAGTDKMHFPRKDHDQGYDPMSWRKPIDRQTKAGKMYKQDSDYRKNTIKSRYRLSGKSATEGVAEAAELNAMRKAAGLPVAEGRMLDESGETLSHIMDRFKHEVDQFEKGGDLDDDLYYALFDYYSDHGEIPYGIAKGRDGDPFEWITDRLDQELGTGNYAPRQVPEADVTATFEADTDAVFGEGTGCNHTMEGEYCPEHGLMECGGMMEMGTVAGGMAPVVGEQGVEEAAKWRDPKYRGKTFDYDDSYEGPGDTMAGKVSLDRAGMRQLPGQTFDPLGYKAREKQATGKLTPQDVKYATAKNFEKEKQQQTDYDRSRKAEQGVAEGQQDPLARIKSLALRK
jgi:hypothetical protein